MRLLMKYLDLRRELDKQILPTLILLCMQLSLFSDQAAKSSENVIRLKRHNHVRYNRVQGEPNDTSI